MILQNVRQLVRQKLDDLQYDGNKIDSAINWLYVAPPGGKTNVLSTTILQLLSFGAATTG